MRKHTGARGTFYYPEENVNLIDTEELKIIVENPQGYVAGDLVRMFYSFDVDNIQEGVNTFEMFSPLVKVGTILRAIFYLPLSAEFANDSLSFNQDLKRTDYVIKQKGETDFNDAIGVLNSNFSYIYLTNSDPNTRSNPIPVFFFSERGAGLFENKILNRQARVADTNFSSVAIRQYKFNPYNMEVGGRNLFQLSQIHDSFHNGFDLIGKFNMNFAGGNIAESLEEGNISEKGDWAPAPEDYEITEVVSGAELAEGMAKFNSSYAFKLLDESEWVTKKLVCPENYIQLFWGDPRSATRFSFWFKIKEIEKSSEAWGEVEHEKELRAGTDIKEVRKDVTKYRFPKTKLKLTSGVFRKDIIDRLKGIAHSPAIFKYNPYTKLNEGRGVVAQVTELRNDDGTPVEQVDTGHFKLNYDDNYSNTIDELIDSPESVFDLEFSFEGILEIVLFFQNRDVRSSYVFISDLITASDFTKKTFNGSIVIDRTKKVKPVLMFVAQAGAVAEIKDIYIKGSLGGIEDVEVEIATMSIIPHQSGESEMELTVISDDFRKPEYLYF